MATLDNFRAGDLPYTPPVVPPTVVAATVTGGGVSQNVGTKPAGGQTGDYYLIWYSESDNPTPPVARACTGFTTESVMHGFPNQHQQWFWKAYTGTEGSTFTVTGNSTQWCGTGVFLLRGLPAGWTPRIVAPSAGTAQFAYTISSQAVIANTLMLLGQKDYDSASTTPPSGLTIQAESGSHVLMSQSFASAGTAGPYTITPGGPGTPNVTSQLFAEAVAATTTPVTASRTTTWNVAAAAVPKVGPGADTTAGSGTSTSSGTSLTVNHGVVDVGETLVVGVVADNVTNATLPTISSITKAAGETNNWVLIGSVDSSTATAGGGVRGMLYAITATVRWAAATQTITLSTAITAKAAVSRTFYGVTTTARGTVPSGTTGAAGVSTSGAPTATTAGTAIVAGDLVLGLAATESTTIPGLDSDTLNGSWVGFSAGLATSGNATTAVALRPQYKIVTAAGAQTFNPTCNTDSGVCVVGLVPQVLTGVTASRATTWVTKFVVTATRTTTWNVTAPSGSVVINRGAINVPWNGGSATYVGTGSSFTPAAGALLVAMPSIQSQNNGGTNEALFSISDTFGDTGGTAWVRSATSGRGPVVNNQWAETADIWTRTVGSSPHAGAVTVSAAIGSQTSGDFAMWSQQVELPAGWTVGLVASPSPLGGDGCGNASYLLHIEVSAAAPAATSVVLSNFTQDYSSAFQYTKPVGFTVLGDQYDLASGWQQIFAAASMVGSVPQTHTWSGLVATNRVMACAIEVSAAVAKPPVRNFSSANLSLAIGSSGSDVFSAFTVAAIVRKSVDNSIQCLLSWQNSRRDDLGSPRGDERQPHAGQQPERRVQGQRPDVDGCRWLVAAGVDARVHQ